MKEILLTTDYSPWANDNSYITCIIREQRFLKHLLFGMMNFLIIKSQKRVILNQRVLVYIHAGFGDRKAEDYQFWPKHCKQYDKLIATDDWNDRGSVEEYCKFFSENEI